MLNVFYGGSRNGTVIETQMLIDTAINGWVSGYRWSPWCLHGSESGSLARVWVALDRTEAEARESWNLVKKGDA